MSRARARRRAAYRHLFENMAGVFAASAPQTVAVGSRQKGLAIAATCVGAMILARTVDDKGLADEICEAARDVVFEMTAWNKAASALGREAAE